MKCFDNLCSDLDNSLQFKGFTLHVLLEIAAFAVLDQDVELLFFVTMPLRVTPHKVKVVNDPWVLETAPNPEFFVHLLKLLVANVFVVENFLQFVDTLDNPSFTSEFAGENCSLSTLPYLLLCFDFDRICESLI